ncbi:YfcL family protein [Marinobacterium rhizophilum]|uniref:YfcL family protein n=1 Tax=Marinobacterium rhizophilum TaxID=420402 RepID=A0ABY5HN83_9GAMM|nr:YfcL family protein [Marinobacterium rhizophilum]UTW13569.1 YfcL family protein [Marinobacterium rhizophilum]
MNPNDYSDSLHSYLLSQEQNTDDNDRLFYCSYLLGHLSLAASTEPDNCAALKDCVNLSLESAFAVDRLSDADKAGIAALWHEAIDTAQA